MKDLAPGIFRKRLLAEGYFNINIDESALVNFFQYITANLSLKTYAKPIVHTTSGEGKEANQGFDAFVPLIDSGIYLAVWNNLKFLSLVMYTCKDFSEDLAVNNVKSYFSMEEIEWKLF
jgi:S-adenosylmethionine decarboxylase